MRRTGSATISSSRLKSASASRQAASGRGGDAIVEKPVHLNPEEQPQSGEAAACEESRDSRRDFLKCAIGAVAAAAAGSALSQPAPAQGTLGPPFVNPAGVASKNGKLPAGLELANEYT